MVVVALLFLMSTLMSVAAALQAEQQAIFQAVNEVRSVGRYCGTSYFEPVSAMRWNNSLAHSAYNHALDMAKRGYFSHQSQDGRSLRERAEGAGYNDWQDLAENIAAGYSIKRVLQGWLDSPSHCKTLMDGELTETGIGFVFAPKSERSYYWVQNFGSR